MFQEMFDTFWHRRLGRPYYLARAVDQGSGRTVILLHGIGRTGKVWQHLVDQLNSLPYRIVAFDLLGFGTSPKPNWIEYNIDDHARAVLASIEKLHLKEPVIIVGHSMGCLVAARVARWRPDLVKHLVLYEMPLYEGLPQKKRYRLRLDLYFKFYEKVIAYKPTFDATTARLAERLSRKIVGIEVDKNTWPAFVKSLQFTIMQQTISDDIKHLPMPMDVIYGSFDMLVIRGKPQQTFGFTSDKISSHTVRARHIISPRACKFMVARIEAAEHPEKAGLTPLSRKRKVAKRVKQAQQAARRSR